MATSSVFSQLFFVQGAFRAVDYQIPVHAAQLSASNGVSHFLLVSSVGATPGASNFYLKTKGEVNVLHVLFCYNCVLVPTALDDDKVTFVVVCYCFSHRPCVRRLSEMYVQAVCHELVSFDRHYCMHDTAKIRVRVKSLHCV